MDVFEFAVVEDQERVQADRVDPVGSYWGLLFSHRCDLRAFCARNRSEISAFEESTQACHSDLGL